MGMFDTIICKYPLPLPDNPKGYTGSAQFQTKDLDQALWVYEIREDGTFWIEKSEYNYLDGDPKAKSFIDRLPKRETIKTWHEQIKYDGDIVFYDYKQTDGDYDYSIDYKATFKKGKLKKVKITDFQATCNKQRKLDQINFANEMKAKMQFRTTMRYKYLYHPYNRVITSICKFLYTYLGNIEWFTIQRKLTIDV